MSNNKSNAIPIIRKESQVAAPQKNKKEIVQPENNNYYTDDALAKRGVYYFEKGQVYAGPAQGDTPSQFLKLKTQQGKK